MNPVTTEGGHSEVTLDGDSLTLEALERVARDPRVWVTCAEAGLERVRRGAAQIQEIVRSYREAYEAGKRDADLPNVYGVTTGFGEFKTQAVHPDQLAAIQANVLRSHAAGVGDTTDSDDFRNYFHAEVVRAALVLRLNTFLKGHSGVRPEIALFVRDMVNSGVIPLVPTRGSVGSSGDLCPLAHLFVVLLKGSTGRFFMVRDRESTRRSRGELYLSDALAGRMREQLHHSSFAARGLSPSFDVAPEPGPKEGLALTNSAAFSAATLALAVVDAQRLASIADVAAAMTLEAVCGRTRALDEKVHRARGLRGQIDSAANMLAILDRGDRGELGKLLDRSEEVQDVYSVRCAPQVHGASRDTIAYARMVVQAEINAATDNPLFFPGESDPCDVALAGRDAAEKFLGDKAAYSAGNFHGQPIGLAADFLACALAELASISERRIQMLLDKNHNRGLPPCLTPDPGVNSGFMIAQYCAAGLVSENKVLAHPASVDSIPTSANTEDHVAMASIAAHKLRTVLANAQSVLAIELMTAAQAIEWRVRMLENRAPLPSLDEPKPWRRAVQAFTADPTGTSAFEKTLSRGAQAAFAAIRQVVRPLHDDRELAEDIRRIRQLIENGDLLRNVEAYVGALRSVPALRSD